MNNDFLSDRRKEIMALVTSRLTIGMEIESLQAECAILGHVFFMKPSYSDPLGQEASRWCGICGAKKDG